MKKSILNLGKTLSRNEQQEIKGKGHITTRCSKIQDEATCVENHCFWGKNSSGGDWYCSYPGLPPL
ncbi:hypothetical protein P8625_06925 [Tenacibaculum tangerinum]|uniref:Uncharacterized protein n=1 Tax=Tenacibaculum tangerinum TaxID=3038772 RepID=A0ABY8L657_9FLAO|nr:hypothetical protein [Tenacibaculum tangerinum]WGH76869.1 hypothetical protein P8625_06925 [Tenacibaculum tangerinum]